METTQTHLLLDIEQRQDEVLQHLDELNSRLECALRDGQSQLKLFAPLDDELSEQPAIC
jgi:hypothetical protein